MAHELKLGGIQEADIVDLAHDGRGIARLDGKAVFVDGALPGERVRFRVFKRRRQWDEAGLVEVVTASPDRVVPACAHFGTCGGCSLQHLSRCCWWTSEPHACTKPRLGIRRPDGPSRAAIRRTSSGNVFVMRTAATAHQVIRRRFEFVEKCKMRREQ